MESEIVKKLKQDILSMQGMHPTGGQAMADPGLGPVTAAFPCGVFPVGIHEFISVSPESSAAVSGFMAGLLSRITRPEGTCMWISNQRSLFPPALVFFGIRPERIIFVDNKRAADLPWMIEQAIRCDALEMIVGEISDLDLAQSRRLQLAAEQSRVNCFLHRSRPRIASAIASVCRWRIEPVASESYRGLPGVGFPAWDVRLEKVRNGQPGNWRMKWMEGGFETLVPEVKGTRDLDLPVFSEIA